MFLPNRNSVASSFNESYQSGSPYQRSPSQGSQSYRSDSHRSSSFASSSVFSNQLQTDDQEKLIHAVLNPNKMAQPIQITKNASDVATIMLKATLVTDPQKNVLITVKKGDKLGNLQVLIGEKMKTSYPDVFESLDGVRAFNITMEKDKLRQLTEQDIIDESFQNNDLLFFEIESHNFWLRINFLLYNQSTFMPPATVFEDESEVRQLKIEGVTKIRVNKLETVKYLRKQLQLLVIQIWDQLSEEDNKYYLMDNFSCISLFPPAQNHQQHESGAGNNNRNSSQGVDAPPAGVFRVQMSGKDSNYNDTLLHGGDRTNKLLNSGGISPSINSNAKIQLVQEKQLSINTEAMMAEQLFSYKNQLEVKAVFIPVFRTTFPIQTLINRANGVNGSQLVPNTRVSSEIKDNFFQVQQQKRMSHYSQNQNRRGMSMGGFVDKTNGTAALLQSNDDLMNSQIKEEEKKDRTTRSRSKIMTRENSPDRICEQVTAVDIFDIEEEDFTDGMESKDMHRSTIALNFRFNDNKKVPDNLRASLLNVSTSNPAKDSLMPEFGTMNRHESTPPDQSQKLVELSQRPSQLLRTQDMVNENKHERLLSEERHNLFTFSQPNIAPLPSSGSPRGSNKGSKLVTSNRRNTTFNNKYTASPFELRAIRLNTYLNVIINSNSVADLVNLIKQMLVVQTSARTIPNLMGKRAVTTNLDENEMVNNLAPRPRQNTNDFFRPKSHNLDAISVSQRQATGRQSANNFQPSNIARGSSLFANLFAKKSPINLQNFHTSNTANMTQETLLANQSNIVDEEAKLVEVASRSHGLTHFLHSPTAKATDYALPVGMQQSAKRGNSSYTSQEDTSVLPDKTDNTPTSDMVFNQVIPGDNSYNGDVDNKSSFARENREDLVRVRPSFGNSRSVLEKNQKSDRRVDETSRSASSHFEHILCTRICNYREVCQLFNEIQNMTQHIEIDVDEIVEEAQTSQKSRIRMEQSLEIRLAQVRQELPDALRVKPTVISMEDVKLEKSFLTDLIEIQTYQPESKKLRNEERGGDRGTSFALSESDLSQVMRKHKGARRSIDVFTGSDPLFNLKNLGLRIKSMQSRQYWQLGGLIFITALAIMVVVLWFYIVLSNFFVQ